MKKIGIVAALPAEARALTRDAVKDRLPIQLDAHVLLCVSGIGAAAAKDAAENLLAEGANCLLSWGIAGGLDPLLPAGTVVLAESVVSGNSDIGVDPEWRARVLKSLDPGITIGGGSLLDAERPVTNAADKSALFKLNSSACVDMESFAIANVAAKRSVPFLIIRAIADPAALTLPAVVFTATDSFGRVKILKFLTSLLFSPSQIPALLRLRNCFNAALASLAKIAQTKTSLLYDGE